MDIHYKQLRDLSFSSPVLPEIFDFATYGMASTPRNGWSYVGYEDFFRIGAYYSVNHTVFYVADVKEDCCALIAENEVGVIFVHAKSFFQNCMGHNFCRYTSLTKEPVIWERNNKCTYVHPYDRVLPILKYDYEIYVAQQIEMIKKLGGK